MATVLWYNDSMMRTDTGARTKRKPSRPKKENKTMSPETTTPTVPTKEVTRTVFDLGTFDKVTLTKVITLPAKPTSIQEALAAVGNDSAALLLVIYDGLCEQAAESAKQDLSGFMVESEDGETSEPYIGTPVDEKKGKAINGAVLNLAKAMGYDKSLSKEKKRELKETAMNALRSNPALVASIQG